MYVSRITNISTCQQGDDTTSSSITLPNSFVELKESPTCSDSFFQKLPSFLQDERLRDLTGPAAAEVAGFLDKLITSVLNDEPSHRRDAIRVLCSLCGSWGMLPASCTLQGGREVVDSCLLVHEDPREIWRGTWGSKVVASKVLKIQNAAYSKDMEQLSEEMVSWRYLKHRNLLPLYGVCLGSAQHRLVSPWMTNGNILAFVRNNPNFNRFKMLVGVCEGLIYLHSEGFVHGGLNRDNVLVDDEKEACLADFCFPEVLGFAKAYSDPGEFEKTQIYKAQELTGKLQQTGDIPPSEKPADVYALGILIFEVLVGTQPSHLKGAIEPSSNGDSPELPPGLQNPDHRIWDIVKRCWMPKPDDRPQLDEIRDALEQCSSEWTPQGPLAATRSYE